MIMTNVKYGENKYDAFLLYPNKLLCLRKFYKLLCQKSQMKNQLFN